MPWCEPCSRFLSPATVTADGRCPTCGRPVAPSAPVAPGDTGGVAAPVAQGSERKRTRDGLPPIPWHFKLLCGAVTLYLGWRAVQGIDWIARHL